MECNVTGTPLSRTGLEHGLLQQLRQQFMALSPAPDCVLVGYSGGADSLALLSLLVELAPSAGFRVVAVHVDHGVRSQAGADAEVAREVCRSLGVDLVVKRLRPDSISRHSGVGREEAMRRERYLCFASCCLERDAGVVVLAHHQHDQAETVLLHLLRGAGLHGVSGMRAVADVTVPWWKDANDGLSTAMRVWRPLLAVSKDDLHAHAAGTGLPIAVDDSNTDESFRRNAIRHTALPLLEEISPGATACLARFAALAAIDGDELDAQAEQALAVVDDGVGLDRAKLSVVPGALQTRVLRRWIALGGPVDLEISQERIEAVLAVMATPGGRRVVEIGCGTSVEVSRDRLRMFVRTAT